MRKVNGVGVKDKALAATLGREPTRSIPRMCMYLVSLSFNCNVALIDRALHICSPVGSDTTVIRRL